MKRRILISLSTALVLAGLCTVAHADGDWPKQGIRLVVPFTAGSGTAVSYTHLTLPTNREV